MGDEDYKEIMSMLAKEIHQIRPYAGAAFLSDDKPESSFWKGRYVAYEQIRKFIEEKRLALLIDEEKEEEAKMFAKHVKKQMATLLPHDHHLFDELVKGLVTEGWTEEGGSPTFRLLNKQGAAIKIFRHAESPQVIKICFSAEPE